MGHKLTGDQLRKKDKRLGEILRQFGQEEYPYDPERAIDALQAFSEGRFGDQLFLSEVLAPELIGAGMKVVEESSGFNILDLEFVPLSNLLHANENLTGEEMRRRAILLGHNFGLVDGKQILAQQTGIPVLLRGKCIMLPKTVLCFRGTSPRFIPFIRWNDTNWVLKFIHIEIFCNPNFYLVRIKQK